MADRLTEERTVPGEIAGKFYWPSEEYSVPADNLCWHIPPEPNRDFRCVRTFGHPGKSPAQGTTLLALGEAAVTALLRAQKNGLGVVARPEGATPCP